MLFPESWLRQWANPDLTSEQLADKLTMAGLEIEDAEPYAPAFTDIVVARIESIAPHPNADKLRICQVNDGSGELLQIVCGAPNAAAGLVVPLARIGAVLPGGMQIAPVKMRGEQSNGMLCSARELGISQDHAGLMELDTSLALGTDIRTALDLDDIIYDLKLTPNRADCLSIQGVARELAALTACDLNIPAQPDVPVTIQDKLAVNVQAPDLCGRFAGRIVRSVNAKAPTPKWMRDRLERAGQRSISALVDISNYVMLELGRPTHVFDLNKINGDLTVRWAQKGEKLELLNGQTIELDTDIGVIGTDSQLESLAGIMGGAATAVSLETTDIFLEAAFWWPEAIMGKARRYKFSSEASHRFERGVDFEHIVEHLDVLTDLVLQICGGQAGPVEDQIVNLPKRDPVDMRLSRCAKIIGIPVQADEVSQIFTSLGFEFTQQDDIFTVTPPSFRFDINIEEDLIEEVARIHGFDLIPDNPPVAPAVMLAKPETQNDLHAMRNTVAGLDYQEVINYSFVEQQWEQNYCANDNPIKLLNPIASQLAVMRSSLIGGLLDNVAYNARHRQSRVRLFEIGRVFFKDDNVADSGLEVAGISQPNYLAAIAWGPALPEQWGNQTRPVDFYDVKSDLLNLLGGLADQVEFTAAVHPALHPGRSAKINLAGKAIGWIGEIHPQWARDLDLNHAPVVFELDTRAITTRPFPQPVELSRQPIAIRDLAIWVNVQESWHNISNTLKQKINSEDTLKVVKDIKLFDIWKDSETADERSLALRFWFQGSDATLDDAKIDHCMQQLTDALATAHGARLRS